MASVGEGLVDLIVPTRGAAQRATANFAGQLTDSPGRSDVEDSPTPSNPFREPAQRTKSVKYRYTATGKHLSSPLKGSSSSPERKQDKPKKSKRTILTPAPPPSPPPPPPPPPSHAAKGKLPAVATTSRKRKASAAPLRNEDLLHSMFTSSPSPLSSVPTSPVVSAKDLPPSPTFTTKESIPGPPKRLSVSKTLSVHSFGTTASKASLFSQPLSPKRKQKKTKTNAQSKGANAWGIGNSVWVLVNQSGVLADNSAHPQSDPESSEPFMWWPAQVVQKQPLRVSMFGDFPSSSSTNRGLCTIFTPSSSNILSINDDRGAKRFSRSTFGSSSFGGPPAKKPRLGDVVSMEARWESAVQSMAKASTLEKDGLPALLSTYATTRGSIYDSLDESDPDISDLTPSLRKFKGSSSKKPKPTESTKKLKPQRSRANLEDNIYRTAQRHRSPCPPDPTLQIPGELILALAPRHVGYYWPAQILRHIPDVKEKYLVKFLDDKQYEITRDKFWTSEEEGFIQCTLGEWESAIKTTDDLDSGDEEEEFRTDNPSAQDFDDSALPPPPASEDFEVLSVRAQLAYVKPILRAILNKEYAPAKAKHDAFMRGGSARVELLKSAGVRGGMDVRFVKAVQKVVCEWVLGVSGVRPPKLDVANIVTESGEGPERTTVEASAAEVAPAEISPHSAMQVDKMEGIEDTIVQDDAHADEDGGKATGSLPSTTDKIAHVSEMVVDGHSQDSVPLPTPANGVVLSPAIQHAALAPKSQLDLLAEVSQAVATEPSLLPSHEVPKLKVQLLDITHRDTSPQPSPLTPVPEEEQLPLPCRATPVVCEDFEALTGIEKLDYCLNILLPESIQQLLLWRSGERTSSALLSPEDEQRLHDISTKKAAETDWVDDVMRLRAAQARLWGVDLNKKAKEKKTEVVQGGTRSRPRRATVSRP